MPKKAKKISAYDRRMGVPPEFQEFDDIEREFLKERDLLSYHRDPDVGLIGFIKNLQGVNRGYYYKPKDKASIHSLQTGISSREFLSRGVITSKLQQMGKLLSIAEPESSVIPIQVCPTGTHASEAGYVKFAYINVYVAKCSGSLTYYKNGVQAVKEVEVGDIVFDENTMQIKKGDHYIPAVVCRGWDILPYFAKEVSNRDRKFYYKHEYKPFSIIVLCQIGDARTLAVWQGGQVHAMRRKMNPGFFGIPPTLEENIRLLPKILLGFRVSNEEKSEIELQLSHNPDGKNVLAISVSFFYMGFFKNALPHGPGIYANGRCLVFLTWNQGSLLSSSPITLENIKNLLGKEFRQSEDYNYVPYYLKKVLLAINDVQLASFATYNIFSRWCAQQAEARIQEERKVAEAARQAEEKRKAVVESQKKADLKKDQEKRDAALKRAAALMPTAVQQGLTVIPARDLQFGKELGKGSFGVVREATWNRTKVAVKQLLNSAGVSGGALEEFKREAGNHARLKHPNVVLLFGVCLEPGQYGMVIEFMEKGSLYSLLYDPEQQIPWSARLGMMRDIVGGLRYLHDLSMTHRDLKSLNVLLGHNMQAKLADFGLAKIKTSAASGTVGGFIGSLYWMAPELFDMDGRCTKASDIYALGMIFFEIVGRCLPYGSAAGNQALVIKWVSDGKRPAIPEDRKRPKGIAALIGRCWAQRAEARPTVDEVAKEVRGFSFTS